jgi:acyl-CoA thioesterase
MTSNCSNGDQTEVEHLAADSDSSSFARLMDLKIIKASPGYALAEVRISGEKHLNFHGTTHGAVVFAVADHACGLCGNSLGRKSVLVNSNINFFANPKPGSVIQAEARMTHVDEVRGTMVIDIRTGKGQPLARCQAVVFFLIPDRSASSVKQKATI